VGQLVADELRGGVHGDGRLRGPGRRKNPDGQPQEHQADAREPVALTHADTSRFVSTLRLGPQPQGRSPSQGQLRFYLRNSNTSTRSSTPARFRTTTASQGPREPPLRRL